MEAIILCGGKGTRLRPLTNFLPKPLLPMGKVPILDILLRQLSHSGFQKVTLAVGPFRRLIEAFAGDGSAWNLRLDYCEEREPLGTAGALTLLPDLPQHFLVLNGDVLCELDFGDFLNDHRQSNAELTIATCEHRHRLDLGVLELGPGSTVNDYLEKPESRYTVSAGIYALSRSTLRDLAIGQHLDLPSVVRKLIAEGRKVRARPIGGLWLDIGRPEDFARARNEVQRFASWNAPAGLYKEELHK